MRNGDAADTTLVVDGADLEVRCYKSRLGQLLENVLDNAIRHAGPDVTVRVGTFADGVGFYLEDDGPGIPVDDRSRVFEGSYTTGESGTDLGLRIVRQVATHLGGTFA